MFADLRGKVAVVTGGGQGLGLGIVRKMCGQGADIVIPDINHEGAKAAAEEVIQSGQRAWHFFLDVTNKTAVNNVVTEILQTVKRVDILVNNAGVASAPGFTGAISRDEDWELAWRVNVKGLVDITEAFLPSMKSNRYGKIINISSVAAKATRYQTVHYGTTKMAVISYTQALAREFAQYNINVNAIAPGRIWTAFHQTLLKNREQSGNLQTAGKDHYALFEEFAQEVAPLRRPQTPEDIGALATFLASDEARNITGQVIQCDGGQVMA